jgi:hypothetical protein
MMTSNEKIVMFMEGKNNLIKGYNKKLTYFKVGDKKEILSWSSEYADRVWKFIKKYKNGAGLSTVNCPFCIYNKMNCDIDSCVVCKYGKRHGKCYDKDSTYDSIFRFISKLEIKLRDSMSDIELEEYGSTSLVFSKNFIMILLNQLKKKVN